MRWFNMMDIPLGETSGDLRVTSPIRRLLEARWLLVAMAVVFLFFMTQWPGSEGILVVAYLLLGAVIAFSPRRPMERTVMDINAPRRQRSLWPETQAKLFVNAIPEPSVVLDGEGVVRHSNQAMKDVFGPLSHGDFLTLKFRDPDIIDALAQTQATGGPVSVPHMVRFPTERHYLIHFSPITLPGNQSDMREGGRRSEVSATSVSPDFIFVVMLEQTERFRVAELRSDFIANVSHELRTPVASLTGFIETLLGPARDDEESRERFLKIMLEQAHRMTRLVNDLLSLSRIEMRSHLKPVDKVDLTTVVHHVVDVMVPLAEAENITINVDMNDTPSWVLGDKDELIQVVQNLVENACKYGSDGRRVEVLLNEVSPPEDFDTDNDTCYMIEVRDYGQGIAHEHLPRLTERFYRVDAEESKQKMGTGLGLAVVKHILTRHRALLKITSVAGEGASFRIYIATDDDQNLNSSEKPN